MLQWFLNLGEHIKMIGGANSEAFEHRKINLTLKPCVSISTLDPIETQNCFYYSNLGTHLTQSSKNET